MNNVKLMITDLVKILIEEQRKRWELINALDTLHISIDIDGTPLNVLEKMTNTSKFLVEIVEESIVGENLEENIEILVDDILANYNLSE